MHSFVFLKLGFQHLQSLGSLDYQISGQSTCTLILLAAAVLKVKENWVPNIFIHLDIK